MPTYRLIAGEHVHGNDADGNRKVFRASHLPAITPGGAMPEMGEPNKAFKDGDNIIKTNRKFKVFEKGVAQYLTLPQRHPNKFVEIDPAPIPEDEEMLPAVLSVFCNSCKVRFKVLDRLAGKTVNCSNCAAEVLVPKAGEMRPVNQIVTKAVGEGKIKADAHGQPPKAQQAKQQEPAAAR